jgi:hypothetical protein
MLALRNQAPSQLILKTVVAIAHQTGFATGFFGCSVSTPRGYFVSSSGLIAAIASIRHSQHGLPGRVRSPIEPVRLLVLPYKLRLSKKVDFVDVDRRWWSV